MPKYLVVSEKGRCLVEAENPECAVFQARIRYPQCKNWRPYLALPADEVAFTLRREPLKVSGKQCETIGLDGWPVK